MNNNVMNELQFLNIEPCELITEWSKIESFLDEQTKIFYEMIENSNNHLSQFIDNEKLKLKYETNYTCIKNYIENGIAAGEFAPEYPVPICVDMFITILLGLELNSKFVYSNKKFVLDQINVMREQLRSILVVI